jgi:hypothetical protein
MAAATKNCLAVVLANMDFLGFCTFYLLFTFSDGLIDNWKPDAVFDIQPSCH